MNPFRVMPSRASMRGISLVEMLVVVAVIGILAALTTMALRGLTDDTDQTKDRANAQHIAQVSSALGAMGVAHVLPDSLGGAEATARLLRQGVQVNKGPFAGQTLTINLLSDDDITAAASYLDLVYDLKEMRLVYNPRRTAFLSPAEKLIPHLASATFLILPFSSQR